MLHSADTPNKALHITVNTDVPWYSMSPSVTVAWVEMSQSRSDKQVLFTITVQIKNFKTCLNACIMINTETLSTTLHKLFSPLWSKTSFTKDTHKDKKIFSS